MTFSSQRTIILTERDSYRGRENPTTGAEMSSKRVGNGEGRSALDVIGCFAVRYSSLISGTGDETWPNSLQGRKLHRSVWKVAVERLRVMLNFMAKPPYLIKIESAFKKIDELIQKAREDTGTTGYQALVEAVQALSYELREMERKTEGTHPDTR